LILGYRTPTPDEKSERDNCDNISVGDAISSHSIIIPFFLNSLFNSDHYLTIMHNNFMPQSPSFAIPMHAQGLMKHVA
jgi:hypothetical protein